MDAESEGIEFTERDSLEDNLRDFGGLCHEIFGHFAWRFLNWMCHGQIWILLPSFIILVWF